MVFSLHYQPTSLEPEIFLLVNASCVFPKWDIPTSNFINWRQTLQSRSQLNFTSKTRTALTQHSWSNILDFLLKNKLLTEGGRKESFCCDNCKAHKKGNFFPDLHSEMSQLLPNSLGYQQKESTEICKYLKTSKQIPGEEGTKKKWGKGCQWIQRCHRLEAAFLKPLEVLTRDSPGKQWHEDILEVQLSSTLEPQKQIVAVQAVMFAAASACPHTHAEQDI